MVPAQPAHPDSILFRPHTSRPLNPYLVLASLILLALAVSGYKLDLPLLVNPDETRYGEAAREMVESGDWIIPKFNYAERFDKPILFYWLIACSYKLFGVSEFSARLPSVVASAGTIALVFLFGCHFWNPQIGFVSALLLLSCAEYFGLSRAAVTDMTLTAFLTLAMYGEYLLLHPRSPDQGTARGGERTRLWGVLIFFIGMGFATLTKGPVGVLFPVSIGVLYLILTRQAGILRSLSPSTMGFGLLLFCVITIPWYAAIILKVGHEYIAEFFLGHNIERLITDKYRHPGSFFYYVPVLLVGALPWSVYLPGMVARLFYTGWAEHAVAVETKRKLIFLGVWFGFIFLFFSFSQSKLTTYLLPLFPALSLLLGYHWVQIINGAAARPFRRMELLWPTGLLFILSMALTLVLAMSVSIGTPQVVVMYTGTSIPGGLLLVLAPIGLSLATLFAWLRRPGFTYASVVTTTIIACVVAVHVALPVYAKLHQIPNRQARWVHREIAPMPDLISYRYFKHGFVFYAQHRIDQLISEQELKIRVAGDANGQRPFVGFTRQSHWDELSSELRTGLSILLQERDHIVFTNSPSILDRRRNPPDAGQ